MFDTKIAIILRDDLAAWQELNVTAFLVAGIVSQYPEIIGEEYCDQIGNRFNALPVQPIVILSADCATIRKVHHRCLERAVRSSIYIDEMFSTGHDAANRLVFAEFGPENAKVAGLAIRAERKTVDKITKGTRKHA